MNARNEIEQSLNNFKTIERGLRACIEQYTIALSELHICEQNGELDLDAEREILSALHKGKEPLTATEIHRLVEKRRREMKSV